MGYSRNTDSSLLHTRHNSCCFSHQINKKVV
jgi:hypothetical protein